MKRHKLVKHTPDHLKPYQCKICDPPKAFVDSTNYKEHTYIHTGERPYTCRYCPKTFNCVSNKQKHERQSHPVEYKANLKQPKLPR